MGKVTIIMVLGLSIAFGIISWSLNRSNTEAIEATTGYVKYSTARNIARSAINLKLRSIDDNKPLGQTLSGSMMGGTYRVDSIFASNDSIGFRSVATVSDTIYRIRTMMQRTPKPFPNITAACGINVDSVKFDTDGKPVINGNNHDINGNLISPPVVTNNLPGVETKSKFDSATVKNVSPKPAIIYGSPTAIGVNPGMANPADFIEEYKASADTIMTTDIAKEKNVTWGTPTNPVIVYIRADPGKTVTIAGNLLVYGVLVIEGSVKVSGNVTLRGLLIPYSNSKIEVDLVGTAQIIGAMLMGGAKGSDLELKGTSDIKYSKAALQQAQMIGKLLFYRVLTWYEDYK